MLFAQKSKVLKYRPHDSSYEEALLLLVMVTLTQGRNYVYLNRQMES